MPHTDPSSAKIVYIEDHNSLCWLAGGESGLRGLSQSHQRKKMANNKSTARTLFILINLTKYSMFTYPKAGARPPGMIWTPASAFFGFDVSGAADASHIFRRAAANSLLSAISAKFSLGDINTTRSS